MGCLWTAKSSTSRSQLDEEFVEWVPLGPAESRNIPI